LPSIKPTTRAGAGLVVRLALLLASCQWVSAAAGAVPGSIPLSRNRIFRIALKLNLLKLTSGGAW